MGSFIEINDTLQLTKEQGFPSELLDVDRHQKNPVTLDEVKDLIFDFKNKSGARIFHKDPLRVFLAQKINGKWLLWGHVNIQSQTVTKELNDNDRWDGESWITNGRFTISKIYDPEYQKIATLNETPPGLSYF